jgi:hypothetical protein
MRTGWRNHLWVLLYMMIIILYRIFYLSLAEPTKKWNVSMVYFLTKYFFNSIFGFSLCKWLNLVMFALYFQHLLTSKILLLGFITIAAKDQRRIKFIFLIFTFKFLIIIWLFLRNSLKLIFGFLILYYFFRFIKFL